MAAPPDPAETPDEPAAELVADLSAALVERHRGGLKGDPLAVEARFGPSASWLACALGPKTRRVEIELFVRDVEDGGIDDGLGVLVDFLDNALEQLFAADRDAYLPLEFTTVEFDGRAIFARMAVRDLVAEEMADALLSS